ncbi:uncharacterized protein B4U79_13275 [Dinothrombium tinctorium]|uniref:Uncharacterized protein n=2 Tax=Dinothrombium tinctorium TaxID=1965070 RepID=A0A443QNB9_9ACAR|nr:uncharacterized protein B4U79_13275 [Dinothrombium tinctorium]
MLEDYSDSIVKLLSNFSKKRSCLRRGSLCNHRPYDCCSNSLCRCYLLGRECRCRRKGLLQLMGKR